MQASRLTGMLEHCGISFSWGTEFGKGGPILAAKIGPGGLFLAADRFFRYRPTYQGYCYLSHQDKQLDSLDK